MKKVIFICTGNACRSQMAEGFLKHYKSNEYKVIDKIISYDSLNQQILLNRSFPKPACGFFLVEWCLEGKPRSPRTKIDFKIIIA